MSFVKKVQVIAPNEITAPAILESIEAYESGKVTPMPAMTIEEISILENMPPHVVNNGLEVFGTEVRFLAWLKKANFFFDNKAPIEFMNNEEGMKYIDDRLVGIMYGDNV